MPLLLSLTGITTDDNDLFNNEMNNIAHGAVLHFMKAPLWSLPPFELQ